MPTPSDAIFWEAEAMDHGAAWWRAEDIRDYMAGIPDVASGMGALVARAGVGPATKSIQVTGGTYRVWMRYLSVDTSTTLTTAQCNVSVKQNGSGPSAVLPAQGEADSFLKFQWASFDAALAAGTHVVTLEPQPFSGLPPVIDCLVVTSDLTYVPDFIDFVAPLYLSVAFSEDPSENVVPVRLRLAGNAFVRYVDTAGVYGNAGAFDLVPGSRTPWVEISRALWAGAQSLAPYTSKYDEVTLDCDAHINNAVAVRLDPPPRSEFTVTLAPSPSPTGAYRTFRRSGQGGRLTLTLSPMHPEQARSDAEWAQQYREYAARTPPVAGRQPRRFPLLTAFQEQDEWSTTEVIGANLAVLQSLGLSGIDAGTTRHEQRRRLGIPFNVTLSFVWAYASANGSLSFVSNVDFAAIKTAVTNELARFGVPNALSPDQQEQLLFIRVMDEMYSMYPDFLASDPASQAGFRAYAQSLGLTPPLFGAPVWPAVMPLTQKPAAGASAADRARFYYTIKYRSFVLVEFLKAVTAIVQQALQTDLIGGRGLNLPLNVGTAANASTELVDAPNMLTRGVDVFAIYEEGALTYGLWHDSIALAPTRQLCGYLMDFMRAACAKNAQPFGLFCNLKRPPWDIAAGAFTEIAHGARLIDFYGYGPHYRSSDFHSNAPEVYGPIKEVTHAVGAVEDYLLAATRAPSRYALLYSHSSDIWDLARAGDGFQSEQFVYAAEQQGLYTLLSHLGYPLDVLTEADVLAGKASAYAAIFVTGPQLPAAVLVALLSWVKVGGFLYVGPGAATSDELNDPAPIANLWLPIIRAPATPFVPAATNPFGFSYYWHLMPLRATVGLGQARDMNGICGYEEYRGKNPLLEMTPWGQAASFPCAGYEVIGQGRVLLCGFFTGMAYLKGHSAGEQPNVTDRVPLDGYADIYHRYPGPGRGPIDGIPGDAEGDYATWLRTFGPDAHQWPSYGPRRFNRRYRELMHAFLGDFQNPPWRPAVTVSGPEPTYLVEAHLHEGTPAVIALANWSYEEQRVTITADLRRAAGQPWAVNSRVSNVSIGGTLVTFDVTVGAGDFVVIP